jgi:ribosomal protein S27E
MGDILKCPRCASDVDVTSFAPGSTVRCSDCGGMLRVPTGRTGVHVAVKEKTTATRPRTAAVAAAPAPQKRESGTRIRQAAVSRGTAVRRQKSSSTTYVLLGILALVLIVGGVIFFLGTPAAPAEPPASAVKPPPKPPPAKASPPSPAPAPEPPPAAPAPAPEAPRGDEAARTNWEEILRNLRGGGGFDVPGRPEQVYFQRVQRMGKSAYPHLLRFIDNEDPALGRAAVALLNALTNQNKPLPNDATKAKLKEEWQAWVAANP